MRYTDVDEASRDLPGGVDGVVAYHYEVPAKLMTQPNLAPKT
jgi:hypothetical protein